MWYAWVRDANGWRHLWHSTAHVGPHWYELCDYQHEDVQVLWIE